MDCIWIYKNSNSDELGYSIKSSKNLDCNRRIVIGDKPQFETDIEHLKPYIVRWQMLSPHHDVINKLQFAISLDISDDFILMNDDFFVMQPTKLKPAHRGPMDKHIAGRKVNDAYTKTLKKTYDYLLGRGIKEPISYELHTPMVFNKLKLKELFDTIIPMISHSSPMLIRSLYGNIYKIGGEYQEDVKNRDNYRELTCISTNEKTFKGEIGDYIRSQF